MTRKEYDAYEERIRSGQVVEHNGRTAASVEELDWIQSIEGAEDKSEEKQAAAASKAARELSDALSEREAAIASGDTEKAVEGTATPSVDAGAAQNAGQSPVRTLGDMAKQPDVNPGAVEAREAIAAGKADATDTTLGKKK